MARYICYCCERCLCPRLERRGELRYQVIFLNRLNVFFLRWFLFKTENNTYHSSYLLLVIHIVNMLLLLLLINNLLDTKKVFFFTLQVPWKKLRLIWLVLILYVYNIMYSTLIGQVMHGYIPMKCCLVYLLRDIWKKSWSWSILHSNYIEFLNSLQVYFINSWSP